jgi:hypothetical protein
LIAEHKASTEPLEALLDFEAAVFVMDEPRDLVSYLFYD